MKSIFVLLLCCGLCGCATLYPPTGVNYPSQKEIQADRTIDAERQWIDAKKAEIEQRLAEVEQAHAKGEITTAEYLTLKSNLI